MRKRQGPFDETIPYRRKRYENGYPADEAQLLEAGRAIGQRLGLTTVLGQVAAPSWVRWFGARPSAPQRRRPFASTTGFSAMSAGRRPNIASRVLFRPPTKWHRVSSSWSSCHV